MSLFARLQRVRIAIRLANMIALIMIAALGLVAWWSYRNLADLSIARAESEAAELMQSIARSVVVSMVGGHSGAPQEIHAQIVAAVEPFTARPDVRSLFVASHDGRVVVAHGPGPRRGDRVSRASAPSCRMCHDAAGRATAPDRLMPVSAQVLPGEKVVTASGPIFNAPGCSSAACHAHDGAQTVLGVIHVAKSLEPVLVGLSRARWRLALFTALMAIVGPLLSLLLLRYWLDSPVRKLIEGINHLAEGRMDDAVLPTMQGELGEVASAFNKMREQLVASQRQLIQSEKMASLGKIAAGVAHEINNPLTGILTYAEDLIEQAEKDDPRLEDYRVIYRETLRCRKIVRNLLDFGKRVEAQPKPTDVNVVLGHTVELVYRLALFRNVRIFQDLQEDLPRVMADPGQLQQVFLNFLVNAAEAMPNGGEIRITTRLRRDGRGIVISVADQGVGIPKEMMDHIFEPFFSTKGGKTTGLGLSVSWGIIEQHGGRIEVHSEPGVGTTFRVHMPIPAEEPRPAERRAS